MRHTSFFARASRKTTSCKTARIYTLLLAAFGMLALGRPAHAQYEPTGLEATSPVPVAQPRPQDPEAYLERQSVADRPRPDFEPLGMHLDSFYIYPSLSVGALYDDNVYYVPHNRIGDGAVVISPTIDVKSDWNVNAVEFFGTADIQRYFNQTTEDTANYAFGMNGRHDIDYNTYLSGVVSYQQSHEDRGSPDAIFGIEPTPFTLTHAEVKYYRGLTRLNLTLIEGFDRYEFSNVGLAGGGFIDEVRRDRTENYTTIRVGYELKPEYEAFVRATEFEPLLRFPHGSQRRRRHLGRLRSRRRHGAEIRRRHQRRSLSRLDAALLRGSERQRPQRAGHRRVAVVERDAADLAAAAGEPLHRGIRAHRLQRLCAELRAGLDRA